MIRYPIIPLNYSQHLKLKYNYHTDISNDLIDIVFNSNVENVIIKENLINRDLLNLKNYNSMDWNIFCCKCKGKKTMAVLLCNTKYNACNKYQIRIFINKLN